MDKILFAKHDPKGCVLPPAYPGDAGFDVVVSKSCSIFPNTINKVDLGISVAVPECLAFTFMTRSSAIAQGLFVLPTLIDSGYRGPLFLFVFTTDGKYRTLEEGVRIAQLVLLTNHAPIELVCVDKLPESHRGANGFGSSGGGL